MIACVVCDGILFLQQPSDLIALERDDSQPDIIALKCATHIPRSAPPSPVTFIMEFSLNYCCYPLIVNPGISSPDRATSNVSNFEWLGKPGSHVRTCEPRTNWLPRSTSTHLNPFSGLLLSLPPSSLSFSSGTSKSFHCHLVLTKADRHSDNGTTPHC